MAQPRSDPFDVPLDSGQRTTLANWLAQELRNADMARQAQTVDVDYWWTQYEQGRTRSNSSLPWPDAADLTSYIPCEKVDAVHARIMRTIWVNPVWTVAGFGKAADRAPFVEEFHQWKVEEERLQNVLDRAALSALVEPRALIEVFESSERRTVRKQIVAKPKQSPLGGMVFNDKGLPELQMNPDTGQYDEAAPEEIGVTTVVDTQDVIRTGPQYRVLPYEDSLILPGHARDKDEIYGYSKRIWKTLRDLKRAAQDGRYDADAVDRLTATGDREPTASLSRAGQNIASQQDAQTAQKELWETLVLVDLNQLFEDHGQARIKSLDDGARWYLVTMHLLTTSVLAVQHDDFDRSRFVPIILFPRANRATEGYSLIGHKLITVTEEHTAYRNMAADRSSLAVNAPIKKVSGALWDEDEQPWGPKAVITVRDHHEIEQQQVADVPASVFNQIAYCDRTAERLAGVNDIASGQVSQESRTLGEVQMATEQSFVRMDLIVRRFQEAMEDLAQIRHAIWKRTLAENPQGIDAPESLVVGLEGRGVPIDQYLPQGKITAALLDGPFRFRPYGSVETADPGKRRNDLISLIGVWPKLMAMQQMMAPQAFRALTREVLQSFHVQNTQAFLGSPTQDLAQQAPMMPGLPGMMPSAPGLPPGGMPGAAPGPPMGMPPLPPLPAPLAPGPAGLQ